MFRRNAVRALLSSVLAACSTAQARLVEIDVVDRERGTWLEPVRHRGREWIAGEPGHRYAVRLTNTTGERVLVVLSIDGVNAVTGQTAHPSQAGYVLDPWQSTEIGGWRKSLDDVAQFVFTDLPDSYAARTGRPDNVGVIGIAVFAEARPYYYPAPPPAPIYEPRRSAGEQSQSRQAPQAADALAREEGAQGLGTGHGAREWSPASHTGFVRATASPAQVTQLRYDDVPALVARGVLPRYPRHRWRDPGPRAFPDRSVPDGFVADPPQW